MSITFHQGGRRSLFRRPLLACLASALLLAACESAPKEEPETPPETLYNRAFDAMQSENYIQAVTLFDEVERQHPYSSWATQAQLMAAYADYLQNKYDDAVIALDRFIELHPGHKNVPYAYYLKGLSYYEQITDVARDQKNTAQALQIFNDLITRFPDSVYARDAKLKVDLARDHLAGKEMEIGRYYERQGQCIAAVNRFRRVIELYQTTTHTPEALHRLTECYLIMGVKEEAQTAAAVLGYNFPGSDWYQDSYALLAGQNLKPEKSESSWLSRIF